MSVQIEGLGAVTAIPPMPHLFKFFQKNKMSQRGYSESARRASTGTGGAGGGHSTFHPDHSPSENLLVRLFGLSHDRMVALEGRGQPDLAQEVIELGAHVQVDLDRCLAPASIE